MNRNNDILQNLRKLLFPYYFPEYCSSIFGSVFRSPSEILTFHPSVEYVTRKYKLSTGIKHSENYGRRINQRNRIDLKSQDKFSLPSNGKLSETVFCEGCHLQKFSAVTSRKSADFSATRSRNIFTCRISDRQSPFHITRRLSGPGWKREEQDKHPTPWKFLLRRHWPRTWKRSERRVARNRNTRKKPPWRGEGWGHDAFFPDGCSLTPRIHGVWRRFRTMPKKRGKMTDRENRSGFTSIHDGKSIRYFIRFAVNGVEGTSNEVAVTAPPHSPGPQPRSNTLENPLNVHPFKE